MNTTCMECGKECAIWEEVSVSWSDNETQIWCYCEDCDIDTFHPIPEDEL